MYSRKNFLPQSREPFACRNCRQLNDDRNPSPRNHCRFCLYSLHVDHAVPGDRLSTCKTTMKPVAVEYSGKKGYMIVHECQFCGKTMKNKSAEDDNFDLIVELTKV